MCEEIKKPYLVFQIGVNVRGSNDKAANILRRTFYFNEKLMSNRVREEITCSSCSAKIACSEIGLFLDSITRSISY